jgi:hypothetical protein
MESVEELCDYIMAINKRGLARQTQRGETDLPQSRTYAVSIICSDQGSNQEIKLKGDSLRIKEQHTTDMTLQIPRKRDDSKYYKS